MKNKSNEAIDGRAGLIEEAKDLIIRLFPPKEYGENDDVERLYELIDELEAIQKQTIADSDKAMLQWTLLDKKKIPENIKDIDVDYVVVLFENGEWRRYMEEDLPAYTITHYMIIPKKQP